ncbi:MAG: type 4a pilus biogenesis protein PilO [Myxococcota bacterium]
MAGKTTSFDSYPLAAKIFIMVFILGLVGALYFFIFHMELSENIETAEARHQTLQQELADAEQRQQEYLRLTQELAAREGLDRRNKRILPAEAEIPAFLQDLNRVSELSGLEMKRVEPRPEEAEQLYIRIPVAITVSGKFHQLSKFFYNVSRLERAISMENIQLADPTINDAEEVILSVTALATTYRRPEEPDPNAAMAPGAQ